MFLFVSRCIFRRAVYRLVLIGCVGLLPRLLAAHPISISECDLQIGPAKATATITIFLEDLYLFHDLQLSAANYLSAAEIRRGLKQHQQFMAERFIVCDAAGRRLQPVDKPSVKFSVPADGVALPELMVHQLQFQMTYPFEQPPAILTVGHQFSGPDDLFPAEMQLRVRPESGTELLQRTLSSGRFQKFPIDWSSDPMVASLSRTANGSDDRTEPASHGSIYSFVYLEDFEVRLEVLLPLLLLEEWISLPRADPGVLSVDEQSAVQPAIQKLFSDYLTMRINGQDRRLALARCDFVGLQSLDPVNPNPRRPVPVANGRVAAILRCTLLRPLDSIDLQWDLFGPGVFGIRTVIFQNDDVERTVLTRLAGRNHIRWQRSEPIDAIPVHAVAGPVPAAPQLSVRIVVQTVLVVLLAGGWLRRRRRPASGLLFAGLLLGASVFLWQQPVLFRNLTAMSADQQRNIRQSLLSNLYRSFDYRDEQQVYDAIARSCDDGLAETIYLQLAESLREQEQGGAVAHVEKVTFVEVAEEQTGHPARDRLAGRCSWIVSGRVEHWGHIHQRKNRFDAVVEAAWIDNAWKLTGLHIDDQRQISAKTRVRRSTPHSSASGPAGSGG